MTKNPGKFRIANSKEHEAIDKAANLLYEVMQQHREIEPNSWACAIFTITAMGYYSSGISYEEYKKDAALIAKHYKYIWDDNETRA